MSKLLEVLAALIQLLLGHQKKKEQEHAQAEADRIHDDPAGWFADHFGVRKQGKSGTSETNTGVR